MTQTSTSLLADITAAGRMKYTQAYYLAQATPSQLKKEIKHLIDGGLITKQIIKKKEGNKYSTFIYLTINE